MMNAMSQAPIPALVSLSSIAHTKMFFSPLVSSVLLPRNNALAMTSNSPIKTTSKMAIISLFVLVIKLPTFIKLI